MQKIPNRAPALAPDNAPEMDNLLARQLHDNWIWVLVRGLMALLFGILALLSPMIAALSLVLIFGAYALADGIFAASNVCPHMGAHLGHEGRVVGESIACPFHGWRFDASGACVEIPYCAEIPERARVRAWHVHEVNEMVFVWYHPGGAPPAWQVRELPGATFALTDLAPGTHRLTVLTADGRTGATEVWAWPDEAELARFIHGCVRRRLPFKLTGGLHHVLRADRVDGPQHGLLNVLTAVDAAAAGALPDQIAACLAERSPGPLTDVLLGMTSEEVAEVRAVFRAYGCCTVTDPIGELVELGLLKEEH